MYLRSCRAQDILFIECYGELYQDKSVFYKVTSTYFLREGAHLPSPESPEETKHKKYIYRYVGDILTDSYTDVKVRMEYESHNSFSYEVTAKYGVQVGYQSIEDVISHKHIGYQLFDYTFSNALDMQSKFTNQK